MTLRDIKLNTSNLNANTFARFLDNYQVIDDKDIVDNLHKAINNKDMSGSNDKPVAIIVTGPIAAGKSTLICNLFDYFDMKEVEYIGTDIYCLKCNCFLSIKTFEERYAKCKGYTYNRIRKAIKERRSFIWETVISKKEKFDMIQEIKDSGYDIIGFFLGNDCVNINIDRANKRAKYHNIWHVAREKIESRYNICMSELKHFCDLVDVAVLVDVSKLGKMAIYKESEEILYSDCKQYHWVSDYFCSKRKEQRYEKDCCQSR